MGNTATIESVSDAPMSLTKEVDPRITASGGRRRYDETTNYEWPGMMSQPNWQQTKVHQHTSYYGCAVCGQPYKTPHAVYTHLAKRHGR